MFGALREKKYIFSTIVDQVFIVTEASHKVPESRIINQAMFINKYYDDTIS